MRLFQDRNQASHLLAEKLRSYKGTNAVVAAIPKGGVPIGYHVAEVLDLPLELLPCKRLNYTRMQGATIGSVSLEDTVLSEELVDLPQDYVASQIAQLRRGLVREYELCHEGCAAINFRHKTILVVDDLLISGDSMLAALHTLKKQKPKKIVVAVPMVSFPAAREIAKHVDELIYLSVSSFTGADEHVFEDFPHIGLKEVNQLMRQASAKAFSSHRH